MRRSAIDATVPAGKHNAGFSDADHALDVAAEYLQMTSVALDRRTEPREMPADAHLREQPHCHPVERVVAVLANLGYEATVAEGGARPIVLARPC